MARKRYSDKNALKLLSEIDVHLHDSLDVVSACRKAGIKKAEIDRGERAGISTEMAEQMKALERENREFKQAKEILRKASAYFAQADLERRART